MRIALESELFGDAWRIYDFIARTFIGSISANLQYNATQVDIAMGDEMFELKGAKVISPGFASVIHWYVSDGRLFHKIRLTLTGEKT